MQENEEAEYEEQYGSEYGQSYEDIYAQQEEYNDESQNQNESGNEYNAEEAGEDDYNNQSNQEFEDSGAYQEQYEDQYDNSSYDPYGDGAVMSKPQYSKDKNQSKRQYAQPQRTEQPSESEEERIHIYEIKLRGQPGFHQHNKIRNEEAPKAQTYSQIHGKTQKPSNNKTASTYQERNNDPEPKGTQFSKHETNRNQNYLISNMKDGYHAQATTTKRVADDESKYAKETNTVRARGTNQQNTNAKISSNVEDDDSPRSTISVRPKFDQEHEQFRNSQANITIQPQQNAWIPQHTATFNDSIQIQQTDVGYVQQPMNWMQNAAPMYNQGIQVPGSMMNPNGYYTSTDLPNQQVYYPQYNPYQCPQPYQQYGPQGFHQIQNPNQAMPQFVMHPYRMSVNTPNYHPGYMQPYPPQPYSAYPDEGSSTRWFSQEQNLPHNQQSVQMQNNIFNEGVHSSSKKTSEAARNYILNDASQRNEIQSCLDEQENFLRKLEEDKKMHRDKIEKGKIQAENQMSAKARSAAVPQKKEVKQAPKVSNFEVEDKRIEIKREAVQKDGPKSRKEANEKESSQKNIAAKFEGDTANKDIASIENNPLSREVITDGLDEERVEVKTSSQRQKNQPATVQQTNAMDKQAQAAKNNQKPLPKGEIFEVVWDDNSHNRGKGESLAEVFSKRKRDLAERLDSQKTQTTKREKAPEKTKEELFQIRKQMMEYKGPKASKEANAINSITNNTEGNITMFTEGEKHQPLKPMAFQVSDCKPKKFREPNPALIERLAGGVRTKVNI